MKSFPGGRQQQREKEQDWSQGDLACAGYISVLVEFWTIKWKIVGLGGRDNRGHIFFFLNIYPHLSIKISNSIKMKMLHNTLEYT